MNPTLRNVLAVIAALFIGSIVNYGLMLLGHSVVAPPEGVNPEDVESIKAHAGLYSAKHFLVPFIAHAIGTLVGVYAVSRLGASKYKRLALIIGGLFFLAGLSMAILLPEFWKFSIIDLLFAYAPFAYLGWHLAGKPS